MPDVPFVSFNLSGFCGGGHCPSGVRRNTGSKVWADTAYRSKKNEAWLEKPGYVSDIHHKKPQGRPMSERMSRANGRRSKIRASIEHVFAQQKGPMVLFVRTIGIVRATAKIGMANLTYNLKRFVWHQGGMPRMTLNV